MTRHFITALTASFIVATALGAPLLAADDSDAGTIFEDRSIPYRGILDKSRETERPVMIDLYTDWCGWCDKLDSETYVDPAVAEFMKENFVNFKINAELGEGPGLVKRYKVIGYPFIVFVDGNGNEIDWIIGFVTAEKFLATAKQVLAGTDTYAAFKKRHEADPQDLDAAVGYARKLEERKDPKDQDEAWAIYEAALDKARETKSPLAGVCLSGVVQKTMQVDGDYDKVVALLEELIADYPDTEGIEGDYFLLAQVHTQIFEDRDKTIEILTAAAERFAGTEKADNFHYNLGLELEAKGALDDALAAYDKIMKAQLRHEVIPAATIRILIKKDLKPKAEEFCLQWRAQVGDDPIEINAVAWCCHENELLLDKALVWAKELIDSDKEETTAFMDTYAWLLYDSGDAASAAEWEEKALFAAETDMENETYAAALKIFREAAEKKDG